MAVKVFISYRRADSAGYSGRVMDRLDRELGRDLVFMDVDAIPLGTNFSKVLHEEIAKCDVLRRTTPQSMGHRRTPAKTVMVFGSLRASALTSPSCPRRNLFDRALPGSGRRRGRTRQSSWSSHAGPKDTARVTSNALDALGRTEEAKALREQYGVASSGEAKPS